MKSSAARVSIGIGMVLADSLQEAGADKREALEALFGNRNKEYILCDTSEIEGYKENPKAPEIVNAHLEWFFKNMKELAEAKGK